jgi:hypothetical protein
VDESETAQGQRAVKNRNATVLSFILVVISSFALYYLVREEDQTRAVLALVLFPLSFLARLVVRNLKWSKPE